MPFEHSAVSRGIIIPYPDGGVPGATRDEETRWVDGHVIDWPLVSNELVGTSIRLQRGGQNNSVV